MTTHTNPAAAVSTGRAGNIGLWILQILLGAFFITAAAGPKLFGEATAVTMFDDIGAGQWFRYFVGAVELIGAVGLFIPRFAGAAATGLVLVMIGAVVTSGFIIDGGLVTITPAIMGGLAAAIAWGRRDGIATLANTARRLPIAASRRQCHRRREVQSTISLFSAMMA